MTTANRIPFNRQHVAVHYQTIDPHRQVARSKESFFNHVLDHLRKSANGQPWILDVGCGYGYFLKLAAARGWRVNGVEIASEAAEVAGKAIGRQKIFSGTIREAEYADETFDAVTLWDVLCFSEEVEEDLCECFRILKQGGTIGLRVRNVTFQKWLFHAWSLFKRILHNLNVRNPYVFHPHNFNNTAMQQLLKRIGFVDVHVCNSPLTRGDPYRHYKAGVSIGAAKTLVAAGAKPLYWISAGRWTIGPSLLVWASKPIPVRSPND